MAISRERFMIDYKHGNVFMVFLFASFSLMPFNRRFLQVFFFFSLHYWFLTSAIQMANGQRFISLWFLYMTFNSKGVISLEKGGKWGYCSLSLSRGEP
jgi:hypothetical protein